MIAAIYARKSTEQRNADEESKSVPRQIENAHAFAKTRGWRVPAQHVYSDDAISGAEIRKLVNRQRLLDALANGTLPFQVLIMSEESRLGREQIETAYALKQITDAGVRVFFYLEDRERTLDNAMDKVMLSLTNFAAEEVKHMTLFREVRSAVDDTVGVPLELLPGARDVARVVLSKNTGATLLLTAAIEWFTQLHYLTSFKDDASLDPFTQHIFRAHWLEESQHARLDHLETLRAFGRMTQPEKEQAIDDLIELVGAVDGLLQKQAELDVENLQRVLGRVLGKAEQREVLTAVLAAKRYTFIESGVTHPNFQELFARKGIPDTAVFGHAKDGNLHFNLAEDVRRPEAVARYAAFMQALVDLVAGKYDGSLKAEHGSGRNMAPFLRTEWGDAAWEAMWRTKQLLDPKGVLNPGVVLNRDPEVHLKSLKPMPEISPLADRCIECGFCEARCPTRELTLRSAPSRSGEWGTPATSKPTPLSSSRR